MDYLPSRAKDVTDAEFKRVQKEILNQMYGNVGLGNPSPNTPLDVITKRTEIEKSAEISGVLADMINEL